MVAVEGVNTVEPIRVLVVDDDALVLSAICRLLEGVCDVVAVGGAREALDLLSRDRGYDVVLCDLMMPEMTGMALYDEAVRLDAGLGSKLIFMTGGAFAPEALDFLRRVGRPCLDKPFTLDELNAALAAAARRVN